MLRSSILDHIYVNNIALLNNVTQEKPCFGDHILIMAFLCISKPQQKTQFRRDWRKYSKERLESCLGSVDWSINTDNVQEMWNVFENKLIKIVDSIVQIAEFKDNYSVNKP